MTRITTVITGMLLASSLVAQVAMPRKNTNPIPEPFKSAGSQKRLTALRVAEMDAKRHLAERIYGHRVNGQTLVYNFVLESDVIRNRVDAFLRGATQVGRPKYSEDGIVYVVYGVKLRKVLEIINVERRKLGNKVTSEVIDVKKVNEDKLIQALGNGALPGAKGMKMVQAKRAAEVDAFRKMAERMAGVKLTSTSTVRKMMLEDDTIQTVFCAFLRGLKPIDIVYNDDGTCEVKLQLKVRETIETIQRIVKKRKKMFSTSVEEIIKINTKINDKYFTVTGVGVPKTGASMTGHGMSGGKPYAVEKLILKKVISKKIVID